MCSGNVARSWEMRNAWISWGKRKEIINLEDLDINEIIILKYLLKKYEGVSKIFVTGAVIYTAVVVA
jgi:hypothetical protein